MLLAIAAMLGMTGNVDLEWIWDVIHLSSEDRTYRLDLDALKDEVKPK